MATMRISRERVVTRLLYVAPSDVGADTVIIRGDEAHHARRVLRLKPQDRCEVFDGQGTRFQVTLTDCAHETITAHINERSIASRPAYETVLIQALPQHNKFDTVVEQATELGVTAIIPMRSERTIAVVARQKQHTVLERWRRIVLQTAKQCRHYTLPIVHDVVSFDQALAQCAGDVIVMMLPGGTCTLRTLAERVTPQPHSDVPVRVALLIGPEGDFTPGEVCKARDHGAMLFSLGPTVLKTTTATVAALAVLAQCSRMQE